VKEVRVEGVTALGHGEAKTWSCEGDDETIHGFVIRVDNDEARGWFAYRNRCAHVGYDLDMGSGRFWSARRERIYCLTHGACFRPADGVCDDGPCIGLALTRYELRFDGDDAVVIVR
jgi:nitrite reductase/ring-hydroxylating ferredoxin subunit